MPEAAPSDTSVIRASEGDLRKASFERLSSGYYVSVKRRGSHAYVYVEAAPEIDIRHLLSTLKRAYPNAKVRVERRH